jgi:hypothetical protein
MPLKLGAVGSGGSAAPVSIVSANWYGAENPNYPNTSLLLHFDGDNEGTDVADNSLFARSGTCGGNAQISTAQSKFGGSSLLCDGTGDSVSFANDAGFNILSGGDYGISAQIYMNALPDANGAAVVALDTNNTGVILRITQGGTGIQLVYPNLQAVTYSVELAASTWHHICAARSGTQHYIGANGTVGAVSLANRTTDAGAGCRIGASNHDTIKSFFNGHIDEVEILNGDAGYTADYTPPTSAHADSADSIVGTIVNTSGVSELLAIATNAATGACLGSVVFTGTAFIIPCASKATAVVTILPNNSSDYGAFTPVSYGPVIAS